MPSSRLIPIIAAGAALLFSGAARAEVGVRHVTDVTGDFVLIGNTLAHACDTPLSVGTVTSCVSRNGNDSSPDVFWRSETSSAAANSMVTPDRARSTAMLILPSGASVVKAYLYWFADKEGTTGGTSAVLDRPAGASLTVTATQTHTFVQPNVMATMPRYDTTLVYLSVADVTRFVEAQGPGAYRVSGVAAHPLDDYFQIAHAGWVMIVIYQRAGDTPHNVALFDGIDRVTGSTVGVSLSGFRVPAAGFDGKLGVVGYDGEIAGAELRFGTGMLSTADRLSDAQNPGDRFFNGTRSYLGARVSNTGDLPQSSGGPGTLSGIDMDVVDITAKLSAGQTSAKAEVAAGPTDGIQTVIWVTSISTFKPDFSTTTKTATGNNPIEFQITATNSGNDTSQDTIVRDPLPAGLVYLAGSLEVLHGNTVSALTDAAGDDPGEYDEASRTIVVRVGMDRSATTGGKLAPAEQAIVRFRATPAAGTQGTTLLNQASITASGAGGAPSVATPSDGDPATAGAQPTPIAIAAVGADAGSNTVDASSVDAAGSADAATALDAAPDETNTGSTPDDEGECDCTTTHRTGSGGFGKSGILIASLALFVLRRRKDR